ncbi:hypothetical protein AURDEDRAFT_166626 [Auricularia subglabra TFB-10046 SS5]|nr:hypothetical protein AURDEDRAFT_166626 [Auricularia subglabra TFB-10046 SS5]
MEGSNAPAANVPPVRGTQASHLTSHRSAQIVTSRHTNAPQEHLGVRASTPAGRLDTGSFTRDSEVLVQPGHTTMMTSSIDDPAGSHTHVHGMRGPPPHLFTAFTSPTPARQTSSLDRPTDALRSAMDIDEFPPTMQAALDQGGSLDRAEHQPPPPAAPAPMSRLPPGRFPAVPPQGSSPARPSQGHQGFGPAPHPPGPTQAYHPSPLPQQGFPPAPPQPPPPASPPQPPRPSAPATSQLTRRRRLPTGIIGFNHPHDRLRKDVETNRLNASVRAMMQELLGFDREDGSNAPPHPPADIDEIAAFLGGRDGPSLSNLRIDAFTTSDGIRSHWNHAAGTQFAVEFIRRVDNAHFAPNAFRPADLTRNNIRNLFLKKIRYFVELYRDLYFPISRDERRRLKALDRRITRTAPKADL